MPAETHTHREAVDQSAVLDLVATIVGVDPDGAATVALVEVGVHDDLDTLHLWAAVVEEFGERTLGDFESPDPRPTTLGDLAEAFHEALSS